MTRPLFSIVMPTRNRPHLLEYTLQTALEQRFDDFEVVVSDNSSDSATRELVSRFDSARLRYVKTERDLSMPDNWEFGLEHSRGRYVTFLCDDDALLPALLPDVGAILAERGDAELVAWGHAQYVHESWFEPQRRNTLDVPAHSDRVSEVPSRERLADLYALCLWECPKPLMLNSMCSDRVINKIRRYAGRVFIPPAPDYSFAASALGATDSFLYMDRPMMINGAAKESIGMSHFYGDQQAIGEFVAEFGDQELTPDVPFPVLTGINIISQTLISAKKLNDRLAALDPTLDTVEYFLANHRELRVWELHGVDVRDAFKRLRQLIQTQDPRTKRKLLRRLRGERLRRFVRRRIIRSTRLAQLERFLRRRPTAPPGSRTFDGASYGFGNILECAQRFDDILARQGSPPPER